MAIVVLRGFGEALAPSPELENRAGVAEKLHWHGSQLRAADDESERPFILGCAGQDPYAVHLSPMVHTLASAARAYAPGGTSSAALHAAAVAVGRAMNEVQLIESTVQATAPQEWARSLEGLFGILMYLRDAEQVAQGSTDSWLRKDMRDAASVPVVVGETLAPSAREDAERFGAALYAAAAGIDTGGAAATAAFMAAWRLDHAVFGSTRRLALAGSVDRLDALAADLAGSAQEDM